MTESDLKFVQEHVNALQKRVRNACKVSGRSTTDVTIVAASKTKPAELIRAAYNEGITCFGENYVQELTTKRDQLIDTDIQWHCIGHLQTNKVKYIAKFVQMIHSVDSFKLAEEISKCAAKNKRSIDILLQVNTSGEESKSGVEPDAVLALAKECSMLPNIRLCGLMALPEPQDDIEQVRPEFRLLSSLRNEIQNTLHIESFIHLSMGMSDDFEIAIEEGATLIRPGTVVFGARSYNN
ncbi:MAG: YggS family pyridoxal phosphate-dependent enzyme [Candidatus Kapaibacterium sp.]